jgi:hypothetical protein
MKENGVNGERVFSMQATRERADGWKRAAEACGASYSIIGTEKRPAEIDGEQIKPPHGRIVFQVAFATDEQAQQFFSESTRIREENNGKK